MDIIQKISDYLFPFLPAAAVVLLIIIVLSVIRYTFEKRAHLSRNRYKQQVITLLLSFAGLIIVILVLPITDAARGQLLSLIGILLSAAIALSATTFVGNAMAGIMLRAVRSFRPGDFIRVGEHFGRVSELGLFHVEIQTEDRDLTTMPNLYLVTNPVKVIRSSGTLVTAELSLGYDVPHQKIEALLVEAGKEAELEEPFVRVISLGDFAVTYRIAGLLKDVKHILSAQSRLREKILDVFQKAQVEIVSPTFMNTRSLPLEKQFIPPSAESELKTSKSPKEAVMDELVFDKAEQAESLEKMKERLIDVEKELEETKQSLSQIVPSEREKIDARIARLESQKKWLKELIAEKESDKK